MRLRYILPAALLLLLPVTAYPNGLSLNSIGPKAFGMGGAFVGLANDYTAIYWNPAGLSQMRNNFIGIFATDIIPMGTFKLSAYGIDTKTKVNHYVAPNIMGAFRFDASDKLTLGLGIYVPAGIGAEWEGKDLAVLSGNPGVRWMSKIGVVNISPAAAYKVSDNFSFGAAVNIFYGMFDMKRPGGGIYEYSESSTGFGYGITLGALAKANERLSIGASFRTKTTVKMSGTAENPAMAAFTAPAESDFDRDVAWPMWISGGIAFRPIDDVVITADIQYSQWSESADEFTTEYDDAIWKAALTPGDNHKFILHWKDATQIRFGLGHKFNENLDFRIGYYYDPAPSPDETYNILFPSIDYSAVTFGTGFRTAGFVFDFGIEYLLGKEREIEPGEHVMVPGEYGMDIWSWSFGAGYEF